MKLWLVIALCLAMTGCASAQVKKPDLNPQPPKIKIEKKIPAPKKTTVKPFVVELRFPVPGGTPSSPFSQRGKDFHRGMDIAAPIGTPVLSCMDGTVVYAGCYKFLWGYGNAILIHHTNNVSTFYAHLNNLKVKKGMLVQKGTVIGHVGNTGKSRGPHLHLELIIKDKHCNPALYFEKSFSLSSKVSDLFYKVKKAIPAPGFFKRLLETY